MNWIQGMNRCTGPDPCTCPITGPHQPDNAGCTRNRLARNRAAFDAKVRTVGYVDRVTGERIYNPDLLGRANTHGVSTSGAQEVSQQTLHHHKGEG